MITLTSRQPDEADWRYPIWDRIYSSSRFHAEYVRIDTMGAPRFHYWIYDRRDHVNGKH